MRWIQLKKIFFSFNGKLEGAESMIHQQITIKLGAGAQGEVIKLLRRKIFTVLFRNLSSIGQQEQREDN